MRNIRSNFGRDGEIKKNDTQEVETDLKIFFDCLTDRSRLIWLAIAGEPKRIHRPPVEVHVKLEPLSDIERIMVTVPGFDRGADE
jgi:hypothetical protein